MDAVEWLLINVAYAGQWLWAVAKSLFGSLFTALDSLLNPILFPVLAVLNPVCTAIGDGVYFVLSPLPVWLGLTILSALTGVVMLLAFRYASNQDAIGRVKDEIKANILVLKLYKDELRTMFKDQARLFWAIAKLQRYILPPVLIMLPPMLLGLAQMGVRYQWRPLQSGEQTHLRMRLDSEGLQFGDPELEPNPGLVVEGGPVPGGGETVWRIRAVDAGRHILKFRFGSHTLEKELVVGDSFQRVSAKRPSRRWTAMLLHPTERALPADALVESVEIAYPHVTSWIHGANYWILYFFVVSMASALIFKPFFKVRF